jgi:hypothetical protein
LSHGKINDPSPAPKADEKHFGHHNPLISRETGGLFLVIAGALFLARAMGMNLPVWLFTWPVLLMAIGLYLGIVSRFRSLFWLIPDKKTSMDGLFSKMEAYSIPYSLKT